MTIWQVLLLWLMMSAFIGLWWALLGAGAKRSAARREAQYLARPAWKGCVICKARGLDEAEYHPREER